MATIYHITTRRRWRSAENQPQYEAESFPAEGFIHCSEAHQVVPVANRFFHQTPNLVLLHIDSERLRHSLVYENLEGGTELFPHVYGPINRDAIVGVSDFASGPEGRFDHHRRVLDSDCEAG